MRDIDYNTINPGVRNFVRYLNDNGFETTDSGDGVTNKPILGDEALDFPHVFIVVDPAEVVSESKRLYELLKVLGADESGVDYIIEGTFNPIDGVATIMVADLDDHILGLK